eukprot:TRINITY_DN27345_c1_g1_i1.p1 TRINITY_DN27345_c1_g1~~TRINITY_DN27345_c1_g1_i1.p1  ORF type:complete len:205 (+),score=48.36 TRINITY_DN27345_c1_g1_i1:50-664(+)
MPKKDLADYKKVKNTPEKAEEDVPENELRIGTQRSLKKYISLAIDLFNDEKGFKTVTLKGRGQAVSNVVSIAEVVKRRVKGLHQLTSMESTEVVDEYEPIDASKGLEKIQRTKYICGLSIVLSLDELDKNDAGYQEPLPEDAVVEEDKELRKRSSNRPRRSATKSSSAGRGGRGAASRGTGRGGNAGRGSRGGRGGRGATRGYR